MKIQQFVSLLLLIVFSSSSYAEKCSAVKNKIKHGHSVFWDADTFRFENDMFDILGNNDDQNYTYGASWGWGNCKAQAHPLYAEWATDFLSFDSVMFHKRAHHFEIALTNFTPDELRSETPVLNDRPYASLLSATSTLYSVNQNDESISYGASFTYGLLGLPLGGALQATWHDVLRNTFDNKEPYDPKGWDNQIGNGGELTAKIEYSVHKKFGNFGTSNSELVGYSSLNLGYYTMASFGFLWNSNQEYINYAYDAFVLANPMGSNNKMMGVQSLKKSFSWADTNIFFGLQATAVGYNALLQCQGKGVGSQHCLASDDVSPVLGEFTIGALIPFDDYNIIISWHGRTSEHKMEGPYERTHSWGGITFNWKN